MKTDLVVAGYAINDKKVLLIHHTKLDLWLPAGGHIDENETPDEALLREFKEETGLDIKILNGSDIPLVGNVRKNLATPFYVNVHSVGNHDHCCLFYLAEAKNPSKLNINSELKNARWFSRKDLQQDFIPEDVRYQANKAFDLYENLNSKSL